ncbi:hypothetical protein LAZ67_14003459 [Cordylochernes scorpioides]|uniref:RNA-directed DNA polymerase n=1 Tax=Cordylochernes scorpioides TaxID=51811 RepID=A0ABY6L8F7_9ARAC|nr:hypothetical protein LAZ67_14003459 [Cordylochernes scorpioides]
MSSVVKSSRHWLLSLPLVSPRASALGVNTSRRTIKVTDEEPKGHQITKGLSGVLKMTDRSALTVGALATLHVFAETDVKLLRMPDLEDKQSISEDQERKITPRANQETNYPKEDLETRRHTPTAEDSKPPEEPHNPLLAFSAAHPVAAVRKTRRRVFWRFLHGRAVLWVTNSTHQSQVLPSDMKRPYRVSPAERRVIQSEVEKMMESKIIRPSSSPWASPIILVRKKDGSLRFCVDCRHLNKIPKKYVYPLPRIDDALDTFAGSRCFSIMDMRYGYLQIKVEEKDREKTAFITPDGLYEFNVMPFGLCNAPATFERMIDNVLRGLKWDMFLCYLDDIVVYGSTFKEHLTRLYKVLKCIQQAGLCLNYKNCHFAMRQITNLGHVVNEFGTQPAPEKPAGTVENHVGHLVTNAEDARMLARLNILQAQSKDKERYDKKHQETLGSVTELRRSRRLQGREPILQPLPQRIEMEDDHRPTVSGSYLPCQRQRDPSTFSGDGNINPGQWLKEYERVSKYNRWDETMKLANVVFYLNGTAGRWFDNNEESLNSWRSFEDAFRGVFGLQEDSARRAEEVLKSRAQKAEKSSESYIQEILSLCHQVNPRMEEGEIVAHIIKGISEDTYQVLVAKDIQTVDEILKFCRHLTTVKQRRIGRTKFARLSNIMPILCVDDSDDLAGLIRRIVREEIQKKGKRNIGEPTTTNLSASTADDPDMSSVIVGNDGRSSLKPGQGMAEKEEMLDFRPFSHASECEKLSGAASNGGEVAIEENPPGYIAAKLKENFVMVEINGRKIKALVDSGADFSVISDKFRRELKTPLSKEPGPILKAANKNLIETLGKCVLNIEVNGLNISFEFVVMVECSHDIIFGWDFFKATEAVIDCGRNELHLGETSVLESREEENQRLFASDDFVIPPKSIKKISVMNEEICGVRDVLVSTSKDLLLRKEVLIPNSLVTFRHGRGSIWVANGASWPQLIPSGMNMCTMESYENENICSLIESSDKLQETQLKSREWSQKINLTLDPGLSEIQRLQLVSCLDEFIGIFDFGSTPIKPTSTVKHKINTCDQSPIKQRPYRVAPSERRLIQDEVNKMIENHIVKPSESPWSSPVILVRKKDGTWRFCVDYRRLNKITKKDVYPLPRIDDALDSLAGSSYFSTMDLRSGYWQIEVDEKDREKTAFITPDGLYEFQVMPFGLCNAPATFERMIDSVLGSLKWNMCLCYLDDIVVYAPTFEEHLRRLQLVLSCIQKAGLSLNHKKCFFGSRRIKILGHLVDANGIHPDPDKVEAVSKFPKPRNISELKSFLGLCSYYRRFIENFSDKARSLHDLLKTEKQFYWDAAQKKSFEVLKTALISEPVFGHFDESADTHLHTDASGHGIGAVLLQIQGGKERPIAYASRSLTKAENNYSTTEKECLAVVWSISKFRPYLFGRPFTVVTDHHSLCWLVGQKDPFGRLARWALKLQEFDVTVIYKNGRKHKDADCLSRSPLENDQPSAVMSITNVDIEQTKDPDLAKIIDNLNSGYTRKEFSIIDGILYKKNYSTTGRPWLMMIPKHLRSEVMADLHDAPTAGHLGFARTYDKVKKRFYWPGLYRTVRQYVSHCRECQRRKKLPRRPAGQLVSIPPVEKPFYKVGVDLLGRFPVSKDGNRWIIVCTNYMTRFTTAYHPQTNGLTERFNKTLGDMLSMYTGVEQKDWDQVLPYVTFAYNTAKQEATGYTPFFLVHAREAETYIDAVLPYLPDEISNDYVGELVTRAEEARQLSRSRLLQSQAKDCRLYDQKHTPVYYQKNDLVWVFTPIRKVGLSEKLLKRYFGPYKVTKKLSEVTYEVEPVDPSPRSRKAKDIVHVIRMKPYLDPEEQHSILLGNTSRDRFPSRTRAETS